MADERAAYFRHDHARAVRRRAAMRRLGLLLNYDGPLTDRRLPVALGDWLLARWRADHSRSAHDKIERLLSALAAHPEVAERDLETYLREFDAACEGLTHKEKRALYFLSLGFQMKEIARFDETTEGTLKERLRSARRKLGAVNTTHAVATAIRKGYLWH